MKITYCWIFIVLVLFSSCRQTSEVDLLIYNAKIYTVDSSFTMAEALAVKNGKIVAVGSTKDLTERYYSSDKLDAHGKFIYPGFIDAHAHFYQYGLGLQTADLVGTTSWENILNKLKLFEQNHKEGWLLGRGWDQNHWVSKDFPNKD